MPSAPDPRWAVRRVRARRTCALLLGGLLLAPAPGCASYEAARLYARGTRALDRGDTATAIATLERAAARAPQASEIHNHLGLAYAAAGREQEALLEFRRALALDCTNDAARANLRALGGRPLPAEAP